jgi:hypothetical protein
VRIKTTSTAVSALAGGVGAGLIDMFPHEGWIGACAILASVLIFLFDVHIEGGRIESGSPETVGKRLFLMGPQILIIAGLAALITGASWYTYRKFFVAPSTAIAAGPLDNAIGLQCAWSAPPSHYRDDKTLSIVEFQGVPDPKYAVDFTKPIAGPARFRRSSDPFKSNAHDGDYWYRCDITNFGSQAVRNLRLAFPVEYRDPVKTGNGVRSGDVVARGFALSADFDLAAGEKDYFYFASASPAFIAVYLPSFATLQTLDSDKIQTAHLVLPADATKRSFSLPPSDNPFPVKVSPSNGTSATPGPPKPIAHNTNVPAVAALPSLDHKVSLFCSLVESGDTTTSQADLFVFMATQAEKGVQNFGPNMLGAPRLQCRIANDTGVALLQFEGSFDFVLYETTKDNSSKWMKGPSTKLHEITVKIERLGPGDVFSFAVFNNVEAFASFVWHKSVVATVPGETARRKIRATVESSVVDVPSQLLH